MIELKTELASKQDLQTAIMEIQNYRQWLSKVTIKYKFNTENMLPAPPLSDAVSSLISQQKTAGAITVQVLDNMIVELKKILKKSPGVVITLGTIPPKELRQQLVNWCRQNLNPNALVDFKFDSTMLGGMALQSGSHFYDWSFRRLILESLDKFPEVLRRV